MAAGTDAYDYVVVGAGAAGSVVAARLAERGASVAIVEAGGPDRNILFHIPAGFARLIKDKRFNWGDEAGPEPALNGRSITWPRGKVLGGSGSINGLVFLRGWAGDFDHWRDLGATGWGYEDVLPYFKRFETLLSNDCDPEFHGYAGPVSVSRIETPSRVAQAFVAAAIECGYPHNRDFNGRELLGAGLHFLNTRNGLRSTTARGHLRPALRRHANLNLLLRHHVERIDFDGNRATGITIRRDDNTRAKLTARREVILCAGAINTPHLLQLSGIGNGETLRVAGIDTRHHLPGVGENLQDHVLARFSFKSREHGTLNERIRSPFGLAKIGLDYIFRRQGPLAISAAEASLFVSVNDADAGPDIQFQVANFSMDGYGGGLHPFPGFVYSATICRPASAGHVFARTADPRDRPAILANYLSAPKDIETLLAGFRVGRKLAQTKALSALIESELRPSPLNDDELIAYFRETATTVFHPCGSCRMGRDDGAVVDPELRAHGLQGLRIADASVMPSIPSTNIHAASIMIGEKAADLVIRTTVSR